MGNRFVDDFLTCVIGRSENDTIVRINSILLVMVMVPFVVIILVLDAHWVYSTYIAEDPTQIISFSQFVLNHIDDFLGAHLVECTVGTYLLFMIMKELVNHCQRDMIWMDALIGYAGSKGCDTSAMEEVKGSMKFERAILLAKIFLAWFVLVFFLCVAQALFLSNMNMDSQVGVYTINVLVMEMVIQIAFCGLYLFNVVQRFDASQVRFTELFVDAMGDQLEGIEPMVSNIRTHRILVHLLLVIVTLGLYSFPFFLVSVFRMNKHIDVQWPYEENLLNAILRKEGAIGILKKEDEVSRGFVGAVKRFF